MFDFLGKYISRLKDDGEQGVDLEAIGDAPESFAGIRYEKETRMERVGILFFHASALEPGRDISIYKEISSRYDVMTTQVEILMDAYGIEDLEDFGTVICIVAHRDASASAEASAKLEQLKSVFEGAGWEPVSSGDEAIGYPSMTFRKAQDSMALSADGWLQEGAPAPDRETFLQEMQKVLPEDHLEQITALYDGRLPMCFLRHLIRYAVDGGKQGKSFDRSDMIAYFVPALRRSIQLKGFSQNMPAYVMQTKLEQCRSTEELIRAIIYHGRMAVLGYAEELLKGKSVPEEYVRHAAKLLYDYGCTETYLRRQNGESAEAFGKRFRTEIDAAEMRVKSVYFRKDLG